MFLDIVFNLLYQITNQLIHLNSYLNIFYLLLLLVNLDLLYFFAKTFHKLSKKQTFISILHKLNLGNFELRLEYLFDYIAVVFLLDLVNSGFLFLVFLNKNFRQSSDKAFQQIMELVLVDTFFILVADDLKQCLQLLFEIVGLTTDYESGEQFVAV